MLRLFLIIIYLIVVLGFFHNSLLVNNIDGAFKEAEKSYLIHHTSNRYLTVIDFTLPSTEKRLWVIDEDTHKIVYNTLVAHGIGSGELYATKFSNEIDTHMSSLGAYRTLNGYDSTRDGYALRLQGLDDTNSNAYKRAILVHGAWYVSQYTIDRTGMVGRTWGCFGVPIKYAKPIIDLIKEGGIIYAYGLNK